MRYFTLLIIGSFILLNFSVSLAQPISQEELFILNVIPSVNNVEQRPTIFWPDYHIKVKPAIIHFSNQHIYALYFKPLKPDWQKRVVSDENIFYLDHDEYAIGKIPLAFNFSIENQPSYIFGYLDDASMQENLHVWFHERFHAYQITAFAHEIFPTETYQGFNQIENTKLAYLEIEILKDYLLHDDIERLKDYVAVNQSRLQLIDPDSQKYEEHKEAIEGTADYMGWKAAIADEGKRNELIIKAYQQMCTLKDIITCMLHRRYYFTGNIIGIALDQQTEMNWKTLLSQKKISPHALLVQALPMSQNEIDRRLADAKQRYHYEEITQPIEAAINQYHTELVREQTNYNNLPGVVIHFNSLPCSTQGTVGEKKIYYIDSNYRLLKEVEESSMCGDSSIKITHHTIPYLFQSLHFFEEFKAAKETQLIVDGVDMTLEQVIANGKPILFHQLVLKNALTELVIQNHPGSLNPSEKSIAIQFNNVNKLITF